MNEIYPFSVELLPYSYSALEPYLSRKTLLYHHGTHYTDYVSKLNSILKLHPSLQSTTLENLIKDLNSYEEPLQTQIRNNAGGVFNHQLYFQSMKEPEFQTPTKQILTKINEDFGSLDTFLKEFSDACLSLFGSGYVWLVKKNHHLEIVSTPNQNTPLSNQSFPCLCIDLWEHAYYLQYQNRKADYVNNWFSLINWTHVDELFTLSN